MKQICLLLLAMTMLACTNDDDNTLESVSKVLYHNDFSDPETITDFEDGFALADIKDGHLTINGGCIAPHFQLHLGPYEIDKDINIKMSAKHLPPCGGAVFINALGSSANSLVLNIDQEEWTEIQNAEPYPLESGETLVIEVVSGGIIGCSSQLDEITVTEL